MDYKWKPIEPLSELEKEVDLSDIQPLYLTWRDFKTKIKKTNGDQLKKFEERLSRSLSIETGILEKLYDLDRGTTEALIEKGFLEELIDRSSTDIEPSTLIEILKDHNAATQLVLDCISGNRKLSKSILLELHSILTTHQEYTYAIDQFENRIQIPLLKGRFKEHPNNPKRPDGTIHEYCPPVHVDSEIENLLSWLDEYQTEDPIIVASWLHHRFTQIHAFQDGNGRVARVITTYVLLKDDLLPLVVNRDSRSQYIEALEMADAGDLYVLASLFSNLEKRAILQALSIDTEAEKEEKKSISEAVIANLADKFRRRKRQREAELLKVNDVAIALRSVANEMLNQTLKSFKINVFDNENEISIFVDDHGTDKETGHWYRFDLIELNLEQENGFQKEPNKWIDFENGHYLVKASIRNNTQRLIIVTSFHHIGRDLIGVIEATTFAILESEREEEKEEEKSRKRISCCLEPFIITNSTDPNKVQPAFRRWLDTCVAIAIKEWGDRL